MKTTQHTILITGGSAGIGFAFAKAFDEQGNHVIITGRDETRLQQAAAQLKNATAIVSDVTKEEDVNRLAARIEQEFPQLDVLINNAGKAFAYNLDEQPDAYTKAGEEMLTNYLSAIRLTEKLLPVLKQQPEAAIVNVSSIVAFVPISQVSTYSASKAALHSYTKSLRFALSRTSAVKVFDVMPPLVNTDFSQDIGGEKGISPAVVAQELLNALASDTYEVHIGDTAAVYALSRSAPAQAFAALNG
nr:SDR family NAD(P)-dependent oxidoreductase [uncultured Arsenicibacter sp.]